MQIISTVCDRCYERNEMTPAVEPTIEFSLGKKRMLVDLCEVHKKELDEAMAPFFEVARRPEGVGPKAAPSASRPRSPRITEPATPDQPQTSTGRVSLGNDCSCGRTFTTQRGLSRHLSNPGELGAALEHAAA